MKNLAQKTLFLSLFPTICMAGFSMKKSEDCGSRSVSSVKTLQELVHKVGGFKDRSNKLVDVNNEISQSVVHVSTILSKGIGTQVCPGVVVTSAHVGLDSHSNVKKRFDRCLEQGKPDKICKILSKYRSPDRLETKVHPFPYDPDSFITKSEGENSFVSPWHSQEPNQDSETPDNDYIFIKLDEELPGGFTVPSIVDATNTELIEASNRGDIGVNLYRAESLAIEMEGDLPLSYDKDNFNFEINNLKSKWKSVKKSEKTCRLFSSKVGKNMIGSDCKTERGVSGSPYIASVNGGRHLIGIHKSGYQTNFESAKKVSEMGRNNFIKVDEKFCSDFKNACPSYECKRVSLDIGV